MKNKIVIKTIAVCMCIILIAVSFSSVVTAEENNSPKIFQKKQSMNPPQYAGDIVTRSEIVDETKQMSNMLDDGNLYPSEHYSFTTPSLGGFLETNNGVNSEMMPYYQKNEALSMNPLLNKMMPRDDVQRSYDSIPYIIIAIEEFCDAFLNLAEWKSIRASYTPYQNLNTLVVTLEDIQNNPDYWYNGIWGDGEDENIFNDTQCHIRNFIKMAYETWNTDYVLLGGDGDMDDPLIPARYCGDTPCDMYYGCLDGNWNNDSDGIFGEASFDQGGGGFAGEEADFIAEVYVGRAPVDTIEEVENFVSKTVAYEQATDDEYLKKAMMMADYADYGAKADYVSEIIPQFTTKKYFLREGLLDKSKILDEMNIGVHIVNYQGHSGPESFVGIQTSDAYQLNNTEYFFLFNGGCHSGNFTRDDAISEAFVVASGGAFSYIGNSVMSVTIGLNSLNILFFSHLMNQSTTHIGEVINRAKVEYITKSEETSDFIIRRGCFMLHLFGDPETQLKTKIFAPTAHFTTEIAEGEWIKFPLTYTGVITLKGIAKRGNAVNASFDHYIIEYGKGFEPDTWISKGISFDGTSETDTILGLWDTRNHDDGPYTLRLTVYSGEGRIGEAWIRFFIVNTYSVHNQNSDTYYLTIQEALDNASLGDTISVSNRVYYENIKINRSVRLIGEGQKNTIINGWGVDDVITVQVEPFYDPNPSIEINGFTIQNSRSSCSGIRINVRCYGFGCTANNIIIKNNIVQDNYYGIRLSSFTSENEIFHNAFINNYLHAVDPGENIWYNDTLHEGNYWDDYSKKYPYADEHPEYHKIWDFPYSIPWSSQSDLYPLMQPFLLGDMNCDGIVDFFDIDPFRTALDGEDVFYEQYPEGCYFHGDVNQDGVIDFFDIDPFVELITGE